MESRMQGTELNSQLFEGDISTHSANESEHETDAEMEIIDDGDSDEECNLHAGTNETQHGEWQNKEHEDDTLEKPRVGMLFDSAEDAYEFYDRYARKMGFNVRIGSSCRSRKNDVIIWRKYLCYREGRRRDTNDKTKQTKIKHRRETRVGCQARLVVKLQVEDGTWVVSLFKEKHNHNFETPKKRRLLPFQRKIDGSQEGLSHILSKEGVKTNITLNYLSAEPGGIRKVDSRVSTSQPYEGEISACSANQSGRETDDEIEIIIEDGDSDKECNIQGDINKIQSSEWQNKVEDDIEKPRVGMLFDSAEDALEFYEKYAWEIGFRVRKGTSSRSRKNDDVIWRRLLCYREGRCGNKNKSEVKHRVETRIGCPAQLVVKLRAGDGTWIVSAFVEKHNHELVKHHMVPSNGKIVGIQGKLVHSITRANIETDLKMNGLSEEAGTSRNSDFTNRDIRNQVSNTRKVEIKKEDTDALLQYFNAMQGTMPNFFYAFQLDANRQLTSLFWTDAISSMDYNYFGDVVCIDASYGTNKYGIPFVPIMGVNHHLQTTYFGGALILNDTEASYMWMLETWMSAMKGRHPKTILTNQDSAMSEAIARVFPNTRHLYCLWHIFQNAQEHLRHLYKQYCSFAKDLSDCIYTNEVIQEFEEGWESLVAKHSLHGNAWMASLYARREQWVPVFSKGIFRADMTTLHRGESINKFFGDILKKEMPFLEFVTAVDKSLVNRRQEELRADYHDNYFLPCRKANTWIEEDMGKIYTKSVFERFQDEILLSLRFTTEKVEDDGTTATFRCWLANNEYIVNLCFSDSSCLCSCQKFECTGILCSHILKVYRVNNVVKIPSQYILKRWTRYAKSGVAVNESGAQIQADFEIPYFLRHNSLCHQGMAIAAKGASSMEVYKVAQHWLEKALMEVENALKRETFGFMGSNNNEAAKIKERKKKRKGNPSNTRLEKGSEGVRDQTNEAAEKLPNDTEMIVDAPSNHQQLNDKERVAYVNISDQHMRAILFGEGI